MTDFLSNDRDFLSRWGFWRFWRFLSRWGFWRFLSRWALPCHVGRRATQQPSLVEWDTAPLTWPVNTSPEVGV